MVAVNVFVNVPVCVEDDTQDGADPRVDSGAAVAAFADDAILANKPRLAALTTTVRRRIKPLDFIEKPPQDWFGNVLAGKRASSY